MLEERGDDGFEELVKGVFIRVGNKIDMRDSINDLMVAKVSRGLEISVNNEKIWLARELIQK